VLIWDFEENMADVVREGEKDQSIHQHESTAAIVFREQKHSAGAHKHVFFDAYQITNAKDN
jgi:hypothetical protein